MVYLALRVHPDCCTSKRRKAKNLLGTPRGTICLAMHFDSASITWPLVIEVLDLEVVLPGLPTVIDYLRLAWGLQVTVLYLQGLCYLAPSPTGTSLVRFHEQEALWGRFLSWLFHKPITIFPFSIGDGGKGATILVVPLGMKVLESRHGDLFYHQVIARNTSNHQNGFQ